MSTEAVESDLSAAQPVAARKGDPQLEQLETELLLEAVFRRYGFDFRSYARSSLVRRLRLRMQAENLDTISGLQDRILHDRSALDRLLDHFSVHVTTMFRDPSFFRTFREQVVPLLEGQSSLRIWHAGCATGEEVYSTAILLREEGLLERARIYATDMNQPILELAKQGIFPLAKMQEYTTNYLQAGGLRAFSEYYVARYDAARFDSSLVEHVRFTRHNLATDGSFSEFDVIFCRNVMIYFDKALKQRALGLFTESLVDLGVLGLGKKESPGRGSHARRYEALSPAEALYRKVA